MKYQICVDKNFGKMIEEHMKAEGKPVQEKMTGDVVEMVVYPAFDPEPDEEVALLLFDGSILGYIRAKINDFRRKIDATRFGWPKMVETEE